MQTSYALSLGMGSVPSLSRGSGSGGDTSIYSSEYARSAAAATEASPVQETAAAPSGDPAAEALDAVKTLNESLVKPPLQALYSVDDETHQIVIKIVNQDSGELLRQIPNEAAVRLARAVSSCPAPSSCPATMPNLVDEKA
jgi:flagellar protein FlaG